MDKKYKQEIQKAENYTKNNKLKEAESLYLSLIESDKTNSNAYSNLSELYINNGDWLSAVNTLIKGEANTSLSMDTFFNLCQILKSMKRYDEAYLYFVKALKKYSHSAELNAGIAGILKITGDLVEAEKYFTKAINLSRGSYEINYNFALFLKEKGDLEKAKTYYLKSLKIKPDFYQVYYNLGNIYQQEDDFFNAIEYYQKCLQINPNYVNAYIALANCYTNISDFDKAKIYYQKLTDIQPANSDNYFHLGNIWANEGNADMSIDSYEKALKIKPDLLRTNINNAFAYELKGDTENAKKYFNIALKIHPDNKLLYIHQNILAPVIPFDRSEIESYRIKLLDFIYDFKIEAKDIDFSDLQNQNNHPPQDLIYHGVDDLEIRSKYANMFTDIFPQKEIRKITNKKPKIAFLVTRGHEGVFIKSMKGIINNLSQEKFDMTIVYNNTNALKTIKDNIVGGIKFFNISQIFSKAIKEMESADFDIIYYWEIGTDSFGYFLPFNRLAPVQCSSWGWPVTSGIKEMDYFISSKNLETDSSNEFYTEKLIQMEAIPTFYYEAPFIQKDYPKSFYSIPDKSNIYLCSQNIRKIHPDFDYIINGILENDSNGVCVFISNKYQFITDKFISRILTKYPKLKNQLIVTPFMSIDEYLGLIKISDISLDTTNYSGANTSYDAFSYGLPVITLPGEYHRGRHTYATYAEMGIDDCLVYNTQEYIGLVSKIIKNPDLRSKISKKIISNKNVLFEDFKVIQGFSDFFERCIDENIKKL